jgi:hypothetical protein
VTDLLTGQVETITFAVQVINLQPATITEVIPGTLGTDVSGTGYSYQWYLDGNAIPGATNQYFTPTFSGNYTVKIIYPGGCENISSAFSFISSLSVHSNHENSLKVFPNPAYTELTLLVPNGTEKDEFTIYNIEGKIIRSGILDGESTHINLSNLNSGVYLLKVLQNSSTYHLNFTIQK